jgi:hypothetical protein
MRKTLPATKQRSRTIGKTGEKSADKTAGKPAGKTALHIHPSRALEFAPPW